MNLRNEQSYNISPEVVIEKKWRKKRFGNFKAHIEIFLVEMLQ